MTTSRSSIGKQITRPGKVKKVMGEYKKGKLKSSSGKKVKKRKQAIAIALSEAQRKRRSQMGPHTLIKRPHNLDEIVGRPTGQGYGAARKGPQVMGPPQNVVVDEDYEQGKAFKVEDQIMAETKLTKAEQALKENNPEKFKKLMDRRQGSSARQMRLSQQKKAEDAGSRKTTPRGGITAMTLGAGPAVMGIVRAGSGLYKILNDKSNKTFKNIQEASKAAKQKGKFKVGDKTYNSLAAANKARRAEKIDMKGLGPKPGKRGQTFNVKTKAADKPATQQLTGAAKRSKLEAAGRAADKMTRTARNKKITSSAKKAIPPAIIATAATRGSKPEFKPLSELPTSTVATRKPPVPLKPRPDRKPTAPKKGPVQGPKDKPLKPLEGGVRYINNPFGKGKIKVDSSDEGMAFEEYGEKMGGRLNKTVRRRMGGKVRGYGKAMRGY